MADQREQPVHHGAVVHKRHLGLGRVQVRVHGGAAEVGIHRGHRVAERLQVTQQLVVGRLKLAVRVLVAEQVVEVGDLERRRA